MRKTKVTPNSRQAAIEIVSFARGDDETRAGLANYQFEADRIVACDGHRLAWQTCNPAVENPYVGLVDENGGAVDGEFPDYKPYLPGQPTMVFDVCSDGDWLPALKTIARLSKRPFGELAYDGVKLTASLKTCWPDASASLTIPLAAGELKPFKLGINLLFLWEALDAARRSDTRGKWYARVAIVDHVTPIVIDTTSGFYSITMPCSCEGAFTTKPEQTAQAA
jgi:DNA polymerase III sliding clamp (beta) subunit (PCNA family)